MLKKLLSKIKISDFIIIVIILANILFYVRILSVTPLAEGQDIFSHLARANSILETEKIDFTFNSSTQQSPLYESFPLMHIEMAALSLVLDIGLPYVKVILDIIIVAILIPSLIYLLGKRLFNNKTIGILTMLLYLSPGIIFNLSSKSSFRLLATPYVSLIMFFAAIITIISLMQDIKKKKLLFLYSIFVFAMILAHPQTAVSRWTILLFITIFLIFIKTNLPKKTAVLLFLLTLLPILVLVAIYFNKLEYFLTIGLQFASQDSPLIQTGHSTISIKMFNSFGPIIFLFSMIGFIILSVKAKNSYSLLAKIIIFSMLIINFIGTYQYVAGLNFFAERFKSELLYPCLLLAAYALFCFRKIILRSKFLTFIISAIIIIPPIIYLSQMTLNIDWNYIKAIYWVKDNLKNEKIMADPWTFYSFKSLAVIEPGYKFRRPGRTEFARLQKQDPAFINIFQKNTEEAYLYAKKNGINYIIIDYQHNPQRLRGDYSKFSNNEYFKIVYSISLYNQNQPRKDLVIYQVIK